jgi:hypothetical protein
MILEEAQLSFKKMELTIRYHLLHQEGFKLHGMLTIMKEIGGIAISRLLVVSKERHGDQDGS